MKYTIDKRDKHTIFTIHEDKIDSTQAPDLKSELIAHHTKNAGSIILDLSEVKYMDSSGLSALLVGNRLLNKEGIFALVAPSKHVAKLLQISQVDRLLNIFPTIDQALDAVNEYLDG